MAHTAPWSCLRRSRSRGRQSRLLSRCLQNDSVGGHTLVKSGVVGIVLLISQLGAGCGGGGGNGTAQGGQSGAGMSGSGGSATAGSGGSAGAGASYGWVSYPGAGYTVNAIWGDRADSLWAVTSGGQLLFYDGAAWQFVFGGGAPALYSIWGLPGQTNIYFVGAGSQFFEVQGSNVLDHSAVASSDNRAVWAAREDQVWVGGGAVGLGLRRYDLTTASASATSEGPSDLQGVRAIWGPTADEIWIVDSNGALVHLLNQTWTRDTSISNPGFTGINGTGSQDVWAVGLYGLFHWDGAQWSENQQGHNAGLFAVWAAGPSEAWAVGDGGEIVHVTPTTFQGVASGTTAPLTSIWGTSPTDIWAGGQNGVLLHYESTSGGSTPDAGLGCKAAGEALGAGDCCAPYNCRTIAGVTLCG